MPRPKAPLAKLEKRAAKTEARIQKKIDKAVANKQAISPQDLKLEAFLEEFMKNGGNATQAALVVFKPSSIESAANLGSYYMKKAKTMTAVYLEKKGYGYGKMLDIATEKMIDHKTPEWWDRLMKMAGYEDFFTKKDKAGPGTTINVFNLQKKMQNEYGFATEGEVVDNDTEEV